MALAGDDINDILDAQNPHFGDLDDEDLRLFDEAFVQKCIAEPEEFDSLYCESNCSASHEVWDDLVGETVLEDVNELNFPAAGSQSRIFLINWILLFICYWWSYCNIADRGTELLPQFLHAFFFCHIRTHSMDVIVSCIISIKFIYAEETFQPP